MDNEKKKSSKSLTIFKNNYIIKSNTKGGGKMYRFKRGLNIDFRDRTLASQQIGIHRNTLGLILRGNIPCSKRTAYMITKLLFAEAEIEDFFNIDYGKKEE